MVGYAGQGCMLSTRAHTHTHVCMYAHCAHTRHCLIPPAAHVPEGLLPLLTLLPILPPLRGAGACHRRRLLAPAAAAEQPGRPLACGAGDRWKGPAFCTMHLLLPVVLEVACPYGRGAGRHPSTQAGRHMCFCPWQHGACMHTSWREEKALTPAALRPVQCSRRSRRLRRLERPWRCRAVGALLEPQKGLRREDVRRGGGVGAGQRPCSGGSGWPSHLTSSKRGAGWRGGCAQ